MPDDWNRFYANVASIPLDSNSHFIRSTSGGFRSYGGPPNGGPVMMMTQLISPVVPLVVAVKLGRIFGYQDVINRSK